MSNKFVVHCKSLVEYDAVVHNMLGWGYKWHSAAVKIRTNYSPQLPYIISDEDLVMYRSARTVFSGYKLYTMIEYLTDNKPVKSTKFEGFQIPENCTLSITERVVANGMKGCFDMLHDVGGCRDIGWCTWCIFGTANEQGGAAERYLSFIKDGSMKDFMFHDESTTLNRERGTKMNSSVNKVFGDDKGLTSNDVVMINKYFGDIPESVFGILLLENIKDDVIKKAKELHGEEILAKNVKK